MAEESTAYPRGWKNWVGWGVVLLAWMGVGCQRSLPAQDQGVLPQARQAASSRPITLPSERRLAPSSQPTLREKADQAVLQRAQGGSWGKPRVGRDESATKPSARATSLPRWRSLRVGLSMGYRRWAVEKFAPRADIAALIAPFQKQLKKQMDTPLAISPIPLERRHPESRLGNLVAEICLARLRSLGWKPDLFITNLGGIRKDLGAGGILIRDVFELLPFENQLILVSLRGDELEKLLDLFAEKRGEPIAGARLVIDVEGKKASSILIQGEPLVRTREYLLGTSDYLVMTGWMSSLLAGKETNSTDLSLRDAMIWGLVERGMRWSYLVDGRVRLASAAPTSLPSKVPRTLRHTRGVVVTSRPSSIKGEKKAEEKK